MKKVEDIKDYVDLDENEVEEAESKKVGFWTKVKDHWVPIAIGAGITVLGVVAACLLCGGNSEDQNPVEESDDSTDDASVDDDIITEF